MAYKGFAYEPPLIQYLRACILDLHSIRFGRSKLRSKRFEASASV